MTVTEFAMTVCQMPIEKQNEFLENRKTVLSEEDYNATVNFITIHKMYMNPAKYKAMKNAVRDMLVEEFYGHEYEEPKKNL